MQVDKLAGSSDPGHHVLCMATTSSETKPSGFARNRKVTTPRSRYNKQTVTKAVKKTPGRREATGHGTIRQEMAESLSEDEKEQRHEEDEEEEECGVDEVEKKNEVHKTKHEGMDAMHEELPPAQDTQLRRTYLQRM